MLPAHDARSVSVARTLEKYNTKMSGDASTGLHGAADCYLLLEDNSVFTGKRFGANISVDGEIGEFMRKREHVFLLLQVGAARVHVYPVSPNQLPWTEKRTLHMMALLDGTH